MRRVNCRRSGAGTQTVAAGPGRPTLVEFEYTRAGPWPTSPRGTCTTPTCSIASRSQDGIDPFGRLVEQVMSVEPYASARRVFWIVDNGSSHAGKTSIKRMQDKQPERASDPPPDPRLLAQPDRALLLDRPTQSADPQRLRVPGPAPRSAARASAITTARSPDRSSGPSPATTSTTSSPKSTTTSPTPDSRPNDQNFRTRLLVATSAHLRAAGRRILGGNRPTVPLCRGCRSRRSACTRPDPRRLASASGCRSRGGAANGLDGRVAAEMDELGQRVRRQR